MSRADPFPNQVEPLATLVHLARRARSVREAAELDFIAVNETYALAPYRQAALWVRTEGLVALSGVVSQDANAPYAQWLARVFQALERGCGGALPVAVAPAHLSEQDATQWDEWMPAHGLWVPVPAAGRRFPGGALLLARDEPWTGAEQVLLSDWVGLWAQARALLASGPLWQRAWRPAAALEPAATQERPTGWRSWIRNVLENRRVWLMAGSLAVLFLPVPLTVLAPAELVPLDPAIIRAPLDGVVDRVLVMPNQTVARNQALFEFDRANIQSRRQVAERALETLHTEYRQKAQQALLDPATKTQLAILQGQIAEKAGELDYLRTLDERGAVASPRAGVVLFDDPTEWVGRPVATGERVMVVADEHAVEIEAWLSPADAIPLASGARVALFLNADPLRPLQAALRHVGHEAIERPNGLYAYRVRATLIERTEGARLGLKGTAKLEGGTVALGYWMVRRPLAALRAWLGI